MLSAALPNPIVQKIAAKSSFWQRTVVTVARLIQKGFLSCVAELRVVYRIVAAKEQETVKWERTSELIAIAKARVWASEGWQVEIIDGEGKSLDIGVLEAPVHGGNSQ
jgi:hypothetical protein